MLEVFISYGSAQFKDLINYNIEIIFSVGKKSCLKDLAKKSRIFGRENNRVLHDLVWFIWFNKVETK